MTESSRKPSLAYLDAHPEVAVCGRCGYAVHEHHTEAHMRRCIDPAANRSE